MPTDAIVLRIQIGGATFDDGVYKTAVDFGGRLTDSSRKSKSSKGRKLKLKVPDDISHFVTLHSNQLGS